MVNNTPFKPTKELNFDTVVANREGLMHYIQANQSDDICLDLSDVIQCDSAGLALLIDAKKLCIKYGKSYTLMGIPEKTRSLAEFCGVQDLLS